MEKFEAVITIKRIGDKDNKFWIQDTNGEFYSSFKSYQGTANMEYNQLLHGNHNEPFKEGDVAVVQFTKTVGNGDQIYKNIKGIFPGPIHPQPSQTAPTAESGRAEPNRGHSAQTKDEAFWEKQAYEKCCSLWAASLLKIEGHDMAISLIEQGYFFDLFQAIKKDSVKRFSPSPQNGNEELPVIQQDEFLMGPPTGMDGVDDIPY